MRYIEKRKISEIAEMYDTNENTVKSWLNYGRKNMRKILETLQKQNKSFLGIAIVPFLIWMYAGEIERTTVINASELAKTIVMESAASKGISLLATKTFLSTAKGKAVTSLVALAIVTGVAGGIMLTNGQSADASSKSTNKTEQTSKLSKSKKKAKTADKEESTNNASSKDESSVSEHEHDWVAQYKTVHHDAVTEMQTVVDQEAYDEPVYSTRTVTKYNINFGNGWALYDSLDDAKAAQQAYYNTTSSYLGNVSRQDVQVEEQYQSGTIHHDAVTHQEKVVTQAAYDEKVLTGYKCSECGKTKSE